jgi:hypothetical protein
LYPLLKKYATLAADDEKSVFIDRDPDLFEIIIQYMKNDDINFAIEQRHIRQLKQEAEFYNLQGLLKLYDRLRYPIETIGQHNIEMKQQEDIIRNLFAVDRDNAILSDPYLSLLPLFTVPKSRDEHLETLPMLFDFEDREFYRLFKTGTTTRNIPSNIKLCSSMDKFYANWKDFANDLFENFNWKNVVVAGGSIVRCVLDEKASTNQKEYYSSSDEEDFHISDNIFKYKGNIESSIKPSFEYTDIDLFLYGVTEKEANQKLIEIFNHLKPKGDVFVLRTDSSFTFNLGNEYPRVQVILRKLPSTYRDLTHTTCRYLQESSRSLNRF